MFLEINHVLWLAFATWHYALFCGYVSDDHAAVEGRTDIIPDEEKVDRGEGFWTKRFNDGIVMFYHTRLFWKLHFKNLPFFWHAFSLGLHLANTYLLYLFLLPIIGHDHAIMTCAFWSINPMLNQNVIWISGRPYLFGAFFTLVAMMCWQNPIAFMAFYFLAVITNLSAFFAPVIMWLIYPHAWQTQACLGILAVVGIPTLIWKFNMRFTKGLVLDRENFQFRRRKCNTLARIFLYYVWTLFTPVRMGWYHQAGFRYNERWEKFNYMTLLGYTLTLGLLLYAKLGGWWFLLGILPNSNLYATNCFVQDRYLYWASIGIALCVAPYLAAYPWLFFIAMTFYVTRAYMYSRYLKDDEKLYRENWRNHPQSDYAVNNLSFFLIQQRRYEEARVIIEQGLNISRVNKMLWFNLGITWAAQGHFGNDEGKFKFLRAIECWKTCLALEPRWAKPANELKKLIDLLVKNKVLNISKSDRPGGIEVTIPNLIGMKEILDGASNATDPATVSQNIPKEAVTPA